MRKSRKQALIGMAMLMITALLAGCGNSSAMQAAAVCEEAARERTQDKTLTVDRKVLAASVANETDNIFRMEAPVTFDAGLKSEYVQTLQCRVRILSDEAQLVNITFVF